jgi:hypothetical protein
MKWRELQGQGLLPLQNMAEICLDYRGKHSLANSTSDSFHRPLEGNTDEWEIEVNCRHIAGCAHMNRFSDCFCALGDLTDSPKGLRC